MHLTGGSVDLDEYLLGQLSRTEQGSVGQTVFERWVFGEHSSDTPRHGTVCP